ncbi:unnamed protein product [Toxocara canis]|uniref:Uncharacterized protein n=1 Tax=Toxocara canis TaxID=6265 RepID=A0A183V0H4_TOXCA|nr:unnamed protein product [Toxocara canis]
MDVLAGKHCCILHFAVNPLQCRLTFMSEEHEQPHDGPLSFQSVWFRTLLNQLYDLSMELSLRKSGIHTLATAFAQVATCTSQRDISAVNVDHEYNQSTQLQEIVARLSTSHQENDVIRVYKLFVETREIFSLLLNSNDKENVASKRRSDVEEILWKLTKANSVNLEQCCSRMIEEKELVQNLEMALLEKLGVMKKTAQDVIEAILRNNFQKQRHELVKSLVRDLENAHQERLTLTDANIANAVSIEEEMRSRIEQLCDRLEAATNNAEMSRGQQLIDEQNLRSIVSRLLRTVCHLGDSAVDSLSLVHQKKLLLIRFIVL